MEGIKFTNDLDTYFENFFEDVSNDFLTVVKEENIDEVNKPFGEFEPPTINDLFLFNSEDNTNYVISEESVINEKLDFLNTKVTPLLISLIKTEDFEFGQSNECIRLVTEQLLDNKIAAQNWFNSLYVKYFISDENILIGLLRIVEYLDENLLESVGKTMAIASIVHRNDEIKELAVRIFENWGSFESLNILKNITGQTKWLQDYIDQVINDINVELCLY